MTELFQDPGLFAYAQLCFHNFLDEFAHYGIEADPGLELRAGGGMLCYYDMQDRQIYMSLPNLAEPAGKLHVLFLRSLLQCQNQDELWRFFYLFLPHVIAHELAHHFRHRAGLFAADNLWNEEQIANQLAVAVTKHRLTPEEKAFARVVLPRALEALATRMESKNIATDSYHNILYALNASGQVGDAAVASIELMQKLFALQPEDILKEAGQLSPEMLERLEQRDDIIDEINDEYATDAIRYIYYHIGWLYLALTGRETQYVEEFARVHLNRRPELLPPPLEDPDPAPAAIQACFRAYRDTRPLSEAGSRYFYKRYRSLLLAKLQAAVRLAPSQREQLQKEAGALLEIWRGREKESDTLVYLAQLAPPALRQLFPHLIDQHLNPTQPFLRHLPAEADLRLWRHLCLRGADAGAANTLRRLDLLEPAEIFRPLPAEVMLEITRTLCRMRLDTSETIIWEGEVNDDVYILVAGQLEVGTLRGGQFRAFDVIRPGEVFGEMAFFTREPRNATVRAAEPSECLVLKGSDLRLLGFQHPAVLIQMAGVLARRLANFIKTNPETHKR